MALSGFAQRACSGRALTGTGFAVAHLGLVSAYVETGCYLVAIPVGGYHRGHLVTSTALTLLVLPTLYASIESRSKRLKEE